MIATGGREQTVSCATCPSQCETCYQLTTILCALEQGARITAPLDLTATHERARKAFEELGEHPERVNRAVFEEILYQAVNEYVRGDELPRMVRSLGLRFLGHLRACPQLRPHWSLPQAGDPRSKDLLAISAFEIAQDVLMFDEERRVYRGFQPGRLTSSGLPVTFLDHAFWYGRDRVRREVARELGIDARLTDRRAIRRHGGVWKMIAEGKAQPEFTSIETTDAPSVNWRPGLTEQETAELRRTWEQLAEREQGARQQQRSAFSCVMGVLRSPNAEQMRMSSILERVVGLDQSLGSEQVAIVARKVAALWPYPNADTWIRRFVIPFMHGLASISAECRKALLNLCDTLDLLAHAYESAGDKAPPPAEQRCQTRVFYLLPTNMVRDLLARLPNISSTEETSL